MELPAFSLLCGLCAAAFSAGTAQRRQLWHWLAGLVLMLGLCAGFTPWARTGFALVVEPQQFAVVFALAAFLLLISPGLGRLSAFLGGASAALWALALAVQGLSLPFAIVLAGALALAALWGGLYRPGFAASRYREEALVIVFVLAGAVALVPGVLAGWRDAVGLGGADAVAGDAGGPGALLVAGMFILFGCIYASWKHR